MTASNSSIVKILLAQTMVISTALEQKCWFVSFQKIKSGDWILKQCNVEVKVLLNSIKISLLVLDQQHVFITSLQFYTFNAVDYQNWVPQEI